MFFLINVCHQYQQSLIQHCWTQASPQLGDYQGVLPTSLGVHSVPKIYRYIHNVSIYFWYAV